ncbi:MAG TPA: geranylgeranylglyceryl/heptaprenylglyceryl phosphate synthase [Bacteroidia bacterium]
MSQLYTSIVKQISKKSCLLAVLIDPEKFNKQVVSEASAIADLFFVGGSTLQKGEINKTIKHIRKLTSKPVVIFPGDSHQVDGSADAILFLSLISGRNPDYLIGKQVESAHVIKQKKLEAIPTGYILVEGERTSATEKVSKTKPISKGAVDLVVKTAIAGEMLGKKMIYLEAGSGAKSSVPVQMIKKVKQNISVPLIVGGGIDSAKKALQVKNAGADVIVIGNALEKDIHLLKELQEIFT